MAGGDGRLRLERRRRESERRRQRYCPRRRVELGEEKGTGAGLYPGEFAGERPRRGCACRAVEQRRKGGPGWSGLGLLSKGEQGDGGGPGRSAKAGGLEKGAPRGTGEKGAAEHGRDDARGARGRKEKRGERWLDWAENAGAAQVAEKEAAWSGRKKEMARVLVCVRERQSGGMGTDTRRRTETRSRATAPGVS